MLLPWVILSVTSVFSADGNTRVQPYDIPAGDAVTTLRQFVRISKAQVLYFTDDVRGIRTNAIKGMFPAVDALRFMLDGTALTSSFDATSGAISINRKTAPVTHSSHAANPPTRAGDEVVGLSPFNVSDSTYHGYVATSTLIGGKTAHKVLDVPQTVSILPRDIIEDTGTLSVTDALIRIVPGVSYVNNTDSASAGVFIRGFRAQNWSNDGATIRTLNRLTSFNVETIEVIKGPASVTFGSFAAYGGYVNLLLKFAHHQPRNKVQIEIGTDNLYSGMVDLGGERGEAGKFQYRLVVGSFSAGRAGWRYDYDRAGIIAPSFAYDFSPTNRVRVRFSATKTDTKGSTTALDPQGRVIQDFSSNGPSPDYHNTETGREAQLIWETELSDTWSTKLNFYGARGHVDWMSNALRSFSGLAKSYPIIPVKQYYTWDNFYTDWSATYKRSQIADTGISYQAVGSLSMDYWNNHYTIFEANQYAPWKSYRMDPTNPDWSLLPRPADLLFPTRYIYYNTERLGGAVLENIVGLMHDRLLLSAAVRYNYDNRSSYTAWRMPRTNVPGGTYVGSPVPPIINEKITKRFGVVYKPAPNLSVYAGSTEAYLGIGAIFKADGSPLKPESGKNEEVGVKFDDLPFLGGNLAFTGAFFRTTVVNKWRGDPANPGFFIQDGAQENIGADAQLTYTSQRFSFVAGYYDAHGPVDRRTGLRAVGAPETTCNFWGKYNLTHRLTVGGGLRHIGDTISSDRLFTTPAFTIMDLFINYALPMGKGAVAYRLGVTNLTDSPAVFSMDTAAVVYRDNGRRIKLTATYTW